MVLRLLLCALLLLSCAACNSAARSFDSAGQIASPSSADLGALPVDGVQPWEHLNADGFVVDTRSDQRQVAEFPSTSEFATGAERFLEGGNVADAGDASTISGVAGSLHWAMYRLVLGGVSPGAIGIDANLHRTGGKLATYWVAVSFYGAERWELHGPFSEPQVTFTLAKDLYVSPLGNTFVAVIAEGDSKLDVVGVTASPVEVADTSPPPAPAAPVLTPVAGGLEATWIPVVAADLAGYRIYHSLSPIAAADANGVQHLPFLEGTTRQLVPGRPDRLVWVAVAAVDINGNESALSPSVMARPLAGSGPALELSVSAVSGQRNAPITLTASGADSYDFDTDGDGVYDITGDITGQASVDTSASGLIRPRVRAGSGDGSAVALGSVSLIISGNQRPVASARVTPAGGVVPLAVTFLGGDSKDFDGTIAEWAWDRTGDGIYERASNIDPDETGTFTGPGFYNAKLRVTDDQGAWDVDTVSIDAQPSTVTLTATPDAINAGQQVSLHAAANGLVSKYEWDIDGDSVYEFDSGLDPSVVFTEARAGYQVYRVRVTYTADAPQTAQTAVQVHGWQTSQDVGGGGGEMSSAAVIGGLPAIAFTEGFDLRYVQALDPYGNAWGPSVLVSTEGTAAYFPSLREINGMPAIAYQGTNNSVLYRRATAADGSSWGGPVTLEAASTGYTYCWMAVIQGYPAVAWHYENIDDLRYCRALDANGDLWGATVAADNSAAQVGTGCCLAEINGGAAIVYGDESNNQIKYVRSTDGAGAIWGAPTIVEFESPGPAQMGLIEVQGRPAITYQDDTDLHLWYTRATTANGTSWDYSFPLDMTDGAGYNMCLTQIGGVPMVTYQVGSTAMQRLAISNDQLGTGWSTRDVGLFITTSTRFRTSLVDLFGVPGISYNFGSSSMRFAVLY
jgi:PKD repeat protein